MALLQLPIDVFKDIIAHAIPREASELHPVTFSPRCNTLTLQLVHSAFYYQVVTQLYRIRPLMIKVFNHAQLEKLKRLHKELPKLNLLMRVLTDQCLLGRHRVIALRRTPLQRFRRVHLHFVPLFAPVNIPTGSENNYHRLSFSGQQPRRLRADYQTLLDLQHRCINDDAWIISHALREVEDDYSALSSGQTSVEVWCHNGPQDVLSRQYADSPFQIPPAPAYQLR